MIVMLVCMLVGVLCVVLVWVEWGWVRNLILKVLVIVVMFRLVVSVIMLIVSGVVSVMMGLCLGVVWINDWISSYLLINLVFNGRLYVFSVVILKKMVVVGIWWVSLLSRFRLCSLVVVSIDLVVMKVRFLNVVCVIMCSIVVVVVIDVGL